MKLGKFLNAVADTIFPKSFTCDICGIETFGTNICPACLKTITFNIGPTCPVCGRKTERPEICLECKYDLPLFKKAVSPFVYDGGTVALIHKFKNGCGYLKEYFADLITEKIKNLPTADWIVYIPMTKKARNKRGYNQAELLANAVSARTNIPVLKDGLIKAKETAEQKNLSGKERTTNLADCFKAERRKDIKDKTILLIDDVLTTGATSRAACKKLSGAGAKCVYFASVASVEYKPLYKKKTAKADN